jgi:methyl-accepting chemotaxis protein
MSVPSRAGLFARFSIGTRVYAAFVATLLLLAGTALAAWLGLSGSAEQFRSYAQYVKLSDETSTLQIDIAALQKAVDDFVKFDSPEMKQQAAGAEKAFRAQIAKLKTTVTHPERARLVGEIDEAGGVYAISIEKLFALMAERDRLVSEVLNGTGIEIRKALTEIVQSAARTMDYEAAVRTGAAQEHYLLARLVAGRFLETGREAERVRKELDELDAILQEVGPTLWQEDQKARLVTLANLLPAYRKGFDSLVEVIGQRAEVLAKAEASGALVRKSANAVMESAAADQDNVGGELLRTSDDIRNIVAILSGLALLLGAALSFAVGRGITRPILALSGAMRTLAEGDTSAAVPGAGRGDEVGAMARTVQVFQRGMIEADRLRAEQEALKQANEETRRAEMLKLAEEFERSVGGIVGSVAAAATEMQGTAQAMSATAEQANRQATAVSAATTQATANVQTVATAAEELSASIAEIGRQVAQSARIAQEAVGQATRTNATVEGLASAAQRIGEVVSLIQNIAGQTNLLALNATIEAARAGEHGKGFAVVASEVKSLATQTAKATEEIGQQIAAIQGATGEAVGAIQGIGATIGQINEIAAAIASAVEEQGAATSEIAGNVQQAAKGTHEVATNIAGVTQASGDVGAAAAHVLGSASELSRQSERLTQDVEAFLATVRAA